MFWLWFKYIDDKISCTSVFYKNAPTTQRMNSGIHIFDVSLELSKGSGYIELFGLKNFDFCDVNLDLSMSESMVKSHSS